MPIRLQLSIARAVCVLASLGLHACAGSDAEAGGSGSEQLPDVGRAEGDAQSMDAGTELSRVATAESSKTGSQARDAAAEESAAGAGTGTDEAPTVPEGGAGSSQGPDAGRSAAPGASEPACGLDSDCKAVDATCETCRCLALPAGIAPPACKGTRVTCVIDPCEDKRAVCRDGACLLQDESPSTF